MKFKDLQNKHEGELEKLLADKQAHLQELRFKVVRGEVKNIKELGSTKRDIARILTLFNQQKQAPTSLKESR